MQRERYLAKSYGDNPEGMRHGLVKILEILGTHTSAVIVVPRIQDVKHGMLADLLGEDATKALLKNREIQFSDGSNVAGERF